MGGGGNRWIRPEVYPVVAVMVVALGMNFFCITRNIMGHPDMRISKDDRASGYLENYDEGKKYKYHRFRAFFSKQEHEVMPGLNAALGHYKRDKK